MYSIYYYLHSGNKYYLLFRFQDAFGAAAIKAGVPEEKLKEWSKDPQVNGKSVFDQLEDTNAKECIEILVNMHKTSSIPQ